MGTRNQGRPVTEARDGAVRAGVVFNGLAIINRRADQQLVTSRLFRGYDDSAVTDLVQGGVQFVNDHYDEINAIASFTSHGRSNVRTATKDEDVDEFCFSSWTRGWIRGDAHPLLLLAIIERIKQTSKRTGITVNPLASDIIPPDLRLAVRRSNSRAPLVRRRQSCTFQNRPETQDLLRSTASFHGGWQIC